MLQNRDVAGCGCWPRDGLFVVCDVVCGVCWCDGGGSTTTAH